MIPKMAQSMHEIVNDHFVTFAHRPVVKLERLPDTMNAECWQVMAIVRTPNPMKKPEPIHSFFKICPNPPAFLTDSFTGENILIKTTSSTSQITEKKLVYASVLMSRSKDNGSMISSEVANIISSRWTNDPSPGWSSRPNTNGYRANAFSEII